LEIDLKLPETGHWWKPRGRSPVVPRRVIPVAGELRGDRLATDRLLNLSQAAAPALVERVARGAIRIFVTILRGDVLLLRGGQFQFELLLKIAQRLLQRGVGLFAGLFSILFEAGAAPGEILLGRLKLRVAAAIGANRL